MTFVVSRKVGRVANAFKFFFIFFYLFYFTYPVSVVFMRGTFTRFMIAGVKVCDCVCIVYLFFLLT